MPHDDTLPVQFGATPTVGDRSSVLLALDAQLDHAFGLVHLSLGDYGAALGPLLRAARNNASAWAPAVVADLVEAGVRAGQRDLVAHAASSLRGWPLLGAGPWERGLVARVEALLAGEESADRLYRRSVDELAAAPDDVALARTQLVYGEWLRRHHRRRQARDMLRAARATFEATPSRAFAARAHAEYLAAYGADDDDSDAAFGLTARELQVARQAAQGRTNREIAATLYVSPCTVDFHLRKVFRKLDIRSRRQLPNALAGGSHGSLPPRLAQPA